MGRSSRLIARSRGHAARILALLAVCGTLCGCELVADFDRSKIPQPDAGAGPGMPQNDAAVPADAALPPVNDDGGGLDEDAGGSGGEDVDAGG